MPRTDPNYPVYRGDTSDHNQQGYLQQLGGKRAFSGWIDKGYFVFAGLASIWLAITALITAIAHSWWAIPLIMVFWGIAAYMTLPRFHRIMTTLYVPQYFIGRTNTADGLLGDPVNLGLRGESVDIHAALSQAGWHRAEPVTVGSSWRIVESTLRKRPYPTAPVSPLYLFDRKEDFAYQQEVDGSPEKRHHVRFWKTPEGWKLPGGFDVDWVAAATFDRAVGLSLFTFQVTHKIDADTDKERDYLIETIQYCNPNTEVEVIKDFSTGYHSRNGGGDSITTDGNLPIVDLNHVVTEQLAIPDHAPESQYSHHRRPFELIEQVPLSVVIASVFVSVLAVIQTVISLVHLTDTQLFTDIMDATRRDPENSPFSEETLMYISYGYAVLLGIISFIQVILAVGVVRGRQRSRKILLAMLCISFLFASDRVLTGDMSGGAIYTVFVLMASHVFAMIEYTKDDAVNYTHNATSTRQKIRAARKQKRFSQ